MSRCFPYPPPGYVKNGIRDEALIQSIKLQREEEKAKKERKKEKKRDKKEKGKAREGGDVESKKHRHKKRHKGERSQEDQKVGGQHKRRENEVENFEKSSLTEEHGHAVGSQNSCDSTLNSNKRQKQSLSPDGRHNPGSIIRIRLPAQRQNGVEVLPSKSQPCSVSGRTDDAYIQGMYATSPRMGGELEEHPCSDFTSSGREISLKPIPEKISNSSNASVVCTKKAEDTLPSNLCSSCPPKVAMQFKNLVEDWILPPVQSECTDFDDEDWLFQSEQKHHCGVEVDELGTASGAQRDSTSWPRACYLPAADVYALPFTVPF